MLLVDVRKCHRLGALGACLPSQARFAPWPATDSSNHCFAGRFLYVDNLVTRTADRSFGFGGQLLAWLVEPAHTREREHLELDSGVQPFDAHRFHLVNRMKISSYHFSIEITDDK
jgi:hypothetical protein